tara:strand:- start:202 stop:366 length:165 start_codon:yes stop_codon:yes gene_type:complete
LEKLKATPLSFLNKVVLSPQNKYLTLDMIAAAAVAVAAVEWNRSFEFELRSLDH